MVETLKKTIKHAVSESKKQPKTAVNYSLGHKSAHCGICEYFEKIEPHHCSKVKGRINRLYWCKLFERK